jgi:hypothetical protein
LAYINTSEGFYTDRIGVADNGQPVFLYFDPASNQFRSVNG